MTQSKPEIGLPVAPSMAPTLATSTPLVPRAATAMDGRTVVMCGLCLVVGAIAGLVAQGLIRLIYLFTNLSFHGHASFARSVAADNHLGPWVIGVPVAGAVVIGLMARYGSRAVAGHGIPEAMEQVLTNQSRIPVRLTFLKPLSAAVSIGTGAPYGAEGPIIATGGAVGSLLGQLLPTTAVERKTLLAAGAAAGIAAAFNSPVAAVLLAVELLLFEFRPRSIIPVALAAAVAAGLHVRFDGPEPFFPFTGAPVASATEWGLLAYAVIGAVIGVGAIGLIRGVDVVEHLFEHRLHGLHWMWHPAVGAVFVGVIGWVSPRTMGPGYFNLTDMLATGHVTVAAMAILCVLKLLSWTISLGSGTAGGTLAPVFTIGGAFAVVLSAGVARLFPGAHLDLRVAALVGMVGLFAGASRALLTSVVFAVETTMEPRALLPALVGCATAYLVSSLLMRQSIMTGKMARGGARVPTGDYQADFLDTVLVREVIAGTTLVTLAADRTVGDVRQWVHHSGPDGQHQGYPVVDGNGHLVGIVTRRSFLDPKADPARPVGELVSRLPVIVYPDATLRDAADHMTNHDVGRLPVVDRDTRQVVGIVTRSDVLGAHRRRLREAGEATRSIRFGRRTYAPDITRP